MALWVAVICLEYEGKAVAWKQNGVVARVILVSRILTTELSQDFFFAENLKDNAKAIILAPFGTSRINYDVSVQAKLDLDLPRQTGLR